LAWRTSAEKLFGCFVEFWSGRSIGQVESRGGAVKRDPGCTGSPLERAAFSNELTEAITKLVAKYHDESAPGGRADRLVVVAHPLPKKPDLE
jgi:hypothetical protein